MVSRFSVEVKARFWKKVDRSSGPDACWIWLGARGSSYGNFNTGAGYMKAHIFAYTIIKGPIAPGLVHRHTCDNDFCCNPRHIKPGTEVQNAQDKITRRRHLVTKIRRTEQERSGVVQLLKVGLPIPRVARMFGVCTRTVDNIKARDRS